jgi:hypothetical protein
MIRVVKELHDPSSQLLRALNQALSEGKLCVVDISQMRGPQGLRLAGIILSDIFDHNQKQFTESTPKTIPTIAVIEEAQSVLGSRGQGDDGPFVSWVKEGRKYDLGALMITQQPSSIPDELLSQGDNFFVFHLLSQGDLVSLKRANAHFSDDLLAALLNEPLVGHGVFWSSAPGTDQHARPYPLSVRVLNFSKAHSIRDPKYDSPALVDTYAAKMRASFTQAAEKAAQASGDGGVQTNEHGGVDAPKLDVEKSFRNAAIEGLRQERQFWEQVRSRDGIKWGTVQLMLSKHAPDIVPDKFKWAYSVVIQALDALLGSRNVNWTTEKGTDGKTWITVTPQSRISKTVPIPSDFPVPEPPPDDDEPPF